MSRNFSMLSQQATLGGVSNAPIGYSANDIITGNLIVSDGRTWVELDLTNHLPPPSTGGVGIDTDYIALFDEAAQ